MTITEAETVADLLVTLRGAQDGIEDFGKSKQSHILFGDLSACGDIRGDGTQSGWEGALGLRREHAVEMMKWLEADTLAKLSALGVADGVSEDK
jgi:hypothetical protein